MSSLSLERARSACGQGILYRLGKGGFDPKTALPFSRVVQVGLPPVVRGCDCSGFIAWCLGCSRDPARNAKNSALVGLGIARWSKWFETTNIWTDAGGPQLAWELVPMADLQPGDVVVYPDGKNPLGVTVQGHIAIVADPVKRTIIDCSSSQSKALGQAITERDGSFFWHKMATRGARLKAAA